MTTVTDDLVLWSRRLRGEDVMIDVETPHAGFYKMRSGRDGPYLPVAIWRKEGELVCRVGTTMRDPIEVWSYCAKNPVTREDAKFAFENDGKWPGDAPVIGHNSGDLSLSEQITSYAANALAWLKRHAIKDETTKNQAANMRAELLRLKIAADEARVEEKRPHDEAAKAVQAKWAPLVKTAEDAANSLRDALTVFMREEQRKLDEERRKAHEEAVKKAEAERKKIEAERAKQLAEDPIAALTSETPELPPIPDAPLPVKVHAGGQRGRRAGLRTQKRYEITDYAAALAHVKDHPDVIAAVEKVAFAQARAGASVPGVKVTEEQVAA
jgi:hypothetical protein